MSTYTTEKAEPTRAGIADVRTYFKVSAVLLAAVAVLGLVLNLFGAANALGASFLSFDWTHNLVHVGLAALAAWLGFTPVDMKTTKLAAKAVGVVYLALALVGFLSPTMWGVGSAVGLHLEVGENLVHLVLGAWGAYAGFS